MLKMLIEEGLKITWLVGLDPGFILKEAYEQELNQVLLYVLGKWSWRHNHK
jgi:hypothetical protein